MKQSQITMFLLAILVVIGALVFIIKGKKDTLVDTVNQSEIIESNPSAKMTQESLTAKKNAVQGIWQSTMDTKSQLQITGDQKIDIYDGKTISTDSYVLNPEAGDAGFVIEATTKDKEVMTYTVIELTETTLQLSLNGGNGQTLSFTKVK